LLARQPSILAVAGGVDARTVKELIALARAQPGKLAFGSAGSGSATHLGGELFRYMAGVELIHLPYKSAGLAMTALLAGEVQVLTTNTATVLPHVKSGRIRALAVSSPKRSSLSPDLPTIAESGLQGFEYDTWYGLFAPAAMADARTARVHADTLQVLRDAKVAERLSAQGVEVVGSSQAELVQFMAAETSRWSRVVAAAGIQPQ
jgi:tripartite-type tricarboxylate transporter receptor subunit TctC